MIGCNESQNFENCVRLFAMISHKAVPASLEKKKSWICDLVKGWLDVMNRWNIEKLSPQSGEVIGNDIAQGGSFRTWEKIIRELVI